MAKVKIHTDETYEDTSTHNVYRRLLDGTYELVKVSGAALVLQGFVGQARNRNINAASSTWASATNTATWTAGLGVTEVTITPEVTTTQSALQNSQACLVAFDAPNDAVASSWLADTGSASTDVNYYMVYNGSPQTFIFTSAITRVDVVPIGTGNTVMRVLVGAN